MDTDKYKKILSIDGGGIMGVFPASLLACIEEQIDGSIYEYFDLIVGTSTGGIIALGLGAGMSAKEILSFYVEYGPRIFKEYIDTNKSKLISPFNYFNKLSKMLNTTLHKNDALKNALIDVFGESKIGNLKTRVMIPSFDINAGKLNIFKTSHHTTLRQDYKKTIVEAAMATSAAPGYLPAYQGERYNTYIDGGLGANNPSGMSVIEGVTKCGWDRSNIRLLSIGCTSAPYNVNSIEATSKGFAVLNPMKLVNTFMEVESQYSEGIAKLLLEDDKERYVRINPIVHEKRFELDNASKEKINELIGLGQSYARNECNDIYRLFFSYKAEPFVPVYKLED